MKPKTKLQIACAEAAATLPAISQDVIQWGYDNCLEKTGHRTKKVIHCLECGHSWKTTEGTLISQIVGEECPACNNQLKTKMTRALSSGDKAYYSQITTHKGWQVIRIFFLSKACKVGRPALYFCTEVMQHWINSKGKVVQWSISVSGGGFHFDMWQWNTDLEIRIASKSYPGAKTRYDIVPYMFYPKKRILPEIKRNGFKGNYHNIAPQDFFTKILSNSKFETLLKAGQFELLKYPGTYYLNEQIERYWAAVKICIRNKYVIRKASDWFDYLSLLESFGKDLRSPKYVCPADLKKEHDRYVAKKQVLIQRQRLEEIRKKMEEEQKEYRKAKKKFFGICFTDGDITVKVLESVGEFFDEGKTHKHCVFTNEYYKREDSLVLSAMKEETRLETVELSLKEMKVLQSRGFGNQPTEYHDTIIQLINNNIQIIQERLQNGNKKNYKTAGA